MKRKDYLSWDEYFMALALITAQRSKDPSTQVGACIVNNENKVLALGYNGAPTGFNDDIDMNWNREGEYKDTKYPYVCHAEINAILNCPTNTKDSRIYVALFPCNECAKALIQAGIKEIIYMCDKYADADSTKISKKMLKTCGVKYRKYELKGRELHIEI